MKSPLTSILFGLCLVLSATISAQNLNDQPLQSTSNNTIDSERHKILMAAVKATELDDVLEKSGPFTVFAPSDAAFERFSSSKIQQLINSQDKSELKSLLSYHIVAGNLTASRILRAMCKGNGKASFTTIQGKKLLAHMEGLDIVLTDPVGNTARITTADLNLKNGVIHEIDSVILPVQM
ncbi:fasciclin domain-containing protein [Flagellimonas nanhaiensis]|uniref:Fasciclin domain-containing protein n=1 Tax=Flagellimonas nanhaiensis TaxID=2292706 RepID=A0A371JUA4_9FLAO|nr:fasciclin domain-containing protein [Allomuricauda nanhaiensis]RDY61359.1 fasciclin domain-containing protein [Allomuricauda nanhaiensis]